MSGNSMIKLHILSKCDLEGSTTIQGYSFLGPNKTNKPQHGATLCVRNGNASGGGSIIGEQGRDTLFLGLVDGSS